MNSVLFAMNPIKLCEFLLGFYIILCYIYCIDAHSIGIHSDVVVTKFGADKDNETTDSEEQPGWMVRKTYKPQLTTLN